MRVEQGQVPVYRVVDKDIGCGAVFCEVGTGNDAAEQLPLQRSHIMLVIATGEADLDADIFLISDRMTV